MAVDVVRPGDHEHRHALELSVAAQRLDELLARCARNVNVEQHKLEARGAQLRECAGDFDLRK